MKTTFAFRGTLAAGSLLVAAFASAQTITPTFSGDYSFVDLGSIAGLPTNYGGLTLKNGDPNTLLIGGSANGGGGAIYAIGVSRDVDGHITGFTGSLTQHATSPFIDGGLAYGPGGVLFSTGFPNNTLMQHKPGSLAPDKTIFLSTLGLTSSVGAANFVPVGFGGAGRLKIASYNSGRFYDAVLTPDGSGTYDITGLTETAALPGNPEGFAYIPFGSAQFANPSMIVSEYGSGKVSVFDIDANGNPLVGTRREFMTGLSGAEGAFIDPLTGDFLFSTFGGNNRVIRVSGFEAPPVPEPASMAVLGLGALALIRKRRQSRG